MVFRDFSPETNKRIGQHAREDRPGSIPWTIFHLHLSYQKRNQKALRSLCYQHLHKRCKV